MKSGREIVRVAVIAGYGELPVMSVKSLKQRGDYVIVIALRESCNNIEKLERLSDRTYIFSVGQVGKMFRTFKKEKITHALLIGKVEINLLEQGIRLDLKALWILAKLSVRSTDTISMAAVKALRSEGITALSQREVLSGYMPGPGVFSFEKPDDKTAADIRLGFRAAKGIGEIDLGQSVVVSGGKIMAVESAEGTDKTFARGCRMANGEGVAVKVAKPLQDKRFDLPTVGEGTLASVIENGGKALIFEACQTIVVDMDKCVRYADENGIIFMAVTETNIKESHI